MKKQVEFKTIEWLINNTKSQKKYFKSFMDFITTNYRDTPSEEKIEEIVKAIEEKNFSYAFYFFLTPKIFQ